MATIASVEPPASRRTGSILSWSARVIVIAITAFWVWFSIMDGLGDAQSLGWMGFLMMLPAALICLATLYVVWRWELLGGLILLAVSALGSYFFVQNLQRMRTAAGGLQITEVLIGLAIFVLPFLLPAVLLLLKYLLDRRGRAVSPVRRG